MPATTARSRATASQSVYERIGHRHDHDFEERVFLADKRICQEGRRHKSFVQLCDNERLSVLGPEQHLFVEVLGRLQKARQQLRLECERAK